MAKTTKPRAREILVPLGRRDAASAKRLLRVDGARCLALGARSARWLNGEEPGALLDLGASFVHARPALLPDGRVVLAGLDGLAVVDRESVETHLYALDAPMHALPAGLSGEGVLLAGVTEPVAAWVDLTGRQRALVDARGHGALIAGGGAAYVLSTRDGALHMTRHDGARSVTATLPWEWSPRDALQHRDPCITGSEARADRLVFTHREVAAVALWSGERAVRVETPTRLVEARLGDALTYLHGAGMPPALIAVDETGATRWSAPIASYTGLYARGEVVLSVGPEGRLADLFDARTGESLFRGAIPFTRFEDLRGGSVDAVPGGVVVTARHLRDPQKHAWRLTRGMAPQKVAHANVAGAVPWGDAGFATWSSSPGATSLSVMVWPT